jgi:hypothetical protein
MASAVSRCGGGARGASVLRALWRWILLTK